MPLNPQRIRETQFKSARRGYDTVEVDQFREDVAQALETAQNEATAMEARARAAVARLQELSTAQPTEQGGGEPAAGATDTPAAASSPAVAVHASVDESETISRTLLLAQRTADATVADAQAEAERMRAEARADADAAREAARAAADQLLEETKNDARRAGEAERVRVEGEVQALLAKRDFLESDVEHLEQFLAAQRERITEAVGELTNLVQRVPNGLADMRRPLLSAAAEEPVADRGDDGAPGELAEITRIAAGAPDGDDHGGDVAVVDDVDVDEAGGVDETGDIWAARDADATPRGTRRDPTDERS